MSRRRPTAREIFSNGPSPDRKQRLDQEEAFYTRLRLPNGLTKHTSAHRLDDVNQCLIECIRGLWPDDCLIGLDIGVSSGITTIELAEALRQEGRSVKIVGTDACIEGTLVSFSGPFHVLCDSNGTALQFELLRCPIDNYAGSGLGFCRRFIPVFFARVLWRLLMFPAVRRVAASTVQPTRLLTDRWRLEPDVTFVEEDFFTAPKSGDRFHIVRACNVLNPRVFSRDQLACAVANLRSQLKPGGLMIVGQTLEDGSNHGACYELQADRMFQRVRSFGTGCEIEPVLLGAASRRTSGETCSRP